ncbi:MAG: hypothetical protein ABUS49_04285, partial [Acidobacteriota bacterium]
MPGQEMPRSSGGEPLIQDAEPSLVLYRQRFRFPGESAESVREGIMGLLNRAEATVFPHEQVVAGRVAACARMLGETRSDPGSLWL